MGSGSATALQRTHGALLPQDPGIAISLLRLRADGAVPGDAARNAARTGLVSSQAEVGATGRRRARCEQDAGDLERPDPRDRDAGGPASRTAEADLRQW